MNYKAKIGLVIYLLIVALMTGYVWASVLPDTVEPGAPFPSGWDSASLNNNFTYTNTSPELMNYTRGYIWELIVGVSQNTHRWIGYVGNISGNISLMDEDGKKLYIWDLNITTGEVYATRFHGDGSRATGNQYDSGVTGDSDYHFVDWTNMRCANVTHITNENNLLGHNLTVDNDAMLNTFVNTTGFKNAGMDFDVADKHIDVDSENCYGTFLMNGSQQQSFWQMVILEDGGTEAGGGSGDGIEGDIVFATIVENSSIGFNGAEYDFQMLLPQHGQVLEGNQDDNIKSNVGYWFYLELIGENWPSMD